DNVAELPVALGVVNARSLLAARLQGEAALAQQPGDCAQRQVDAAPAQGLAQFAEGPMRPLQAGDRVARHGVPKQLLQDLQDRRTFFSTHWPPAPGRRTRPSERKGWRSSRRPRATVLRASPVMRAKRIMPPGPCWRARKPASRRRVRSSEAARRRLRARCSR